MHDIIASDQFNIMFRPATGDLRFDLQMRTYDLQQLAQVLQRVYSFSAADKKLWVNDNGDIIMQAFDQLVWETSQHLEGLRMDTETLTISKDFVTTLRDTGELLQGLVSRKTRLQS